MVFTSAIVTTNVSTSPSVIANVEEASLIALHSIGSRNPQRVLGFHRLVAFADESILGYLRYLDLGSQRHNLDDGKLVITAKVLVSFWFSFSCLDFNDSY